MNIQVITQNIKNNIWTTISIVLTSLLQIVNFASEFLADQNLTWLATASTIITFLILVYDRIILPNFSSNDMADFSSENRGYNARIESNESIVPQDAIRWKYNR